MESNNLPRTYHGRVASTLASPNSAAVAQSGQPLVSTAPDSELASRTINRRKGRKMRQKTKLELTTDGTGRSSKDLYKIPQIEIALPKEGTLSEFKAEPTPTLPKTGLDDYLIQDFTEEQREYIVSQLYPHLKQAMMHFVQKSIQTDDYKAKVDKVAAVKTAIDLDKDASEVKGKQPDNLKNQAGASQSSGPSGGGFGQYKMQSAQPPISQGVQGSSSLSGSSLRQNPPQQSTSQANPGSSFGAFGGYSINAAAEDKKNVEEQKKAAGGGSFGNFKMQQQQPQASSSFSQGFSMNAGAGQQAQAPKSAFGGYSMQKQNEPGKELEATQNIQSNPQLLPIQRSQSISQRLNEAVPSLQLFSLCLDGLVKKELTNLNPNIFRTVQSNQGAAQSNNTTQFKQIIPDQKYRQNKRTSVFQKIDISALDAGNIPSYNKTEEQMNALLPTLKNNFLTKNLNDDEIKKLAGAMQLKSYARKEQIIRYGDTGKLYYILSKGSVQIIVYKQGTDPNDPEIDSKKQFIKYMNQGSGFGELALLYNDKRSATIEAAEDCECYTLDGQIFKAIIVSSSIQKRSLLAGFLNQIKLFDDLDKFQKLKLVDGLETMNLKKGDFVLKEGDEGQEFYIIELGDVECLKLTQDHGVPKFISVRELSKGEHFGELALINNEKRSLSIRVKSQSMRLLKLERETFTRILGSIEQFLNKDYQREFDAKIEQVLQQKRTLSQMFDISQFQEIIDAKQMLNPLNASTNAELYQQLNNSISELNEKEKSQKDTVTSSLIFDNIVLSQNP